MKVLAAVDKFRGTATAAQVATAIGHACWQLGHDCIERPLADGGEGTLEALGGANRTTLVTGPLGDPVNASWRLHRGTAIIEMACASGLMISGGKEKNDAVAASTTGTGEIIDAALDLGAKRIIVCLGGSATTDGGLGAVRAIQTPARLKGVEFVVACDVTTAFTDAAKVFGPQKGASNAQVQLLTTRLERLVQMYKQTYGVDVSLLPGAGAAGGLAGGLAALGAKLVPGFDLVAEEVLLDELLIGIDLVITGEGYMDSESFSGKVVGSMAELAAEKKSESRQFVVIFTKMCTADSMRLVSLNYLGVRTQCNNRCIASNKLHYNFCVTQNNFEVLLPCCRRWRNRHNRRNRYHRCDYGGACNRKWYSGDVSAQQNQNACFAEFSGFGRNRLWHRCDCNSTEFFGDRSRGSFTAEQVIHHRHGLFWCDFTFVESRLHDETSTLQLSSQLTSTACDSRSIGDLNFERGQDDRRCNRNVKHGRFGWCNCVLSWRCESLAGVIAADITQDKKSKKQSEYGDND